MRVLKREIQKSLRKLTNFRYTGYSRKHLQINDPIAPYKRLLFIQGPNLNFRSLIKTTNYYEWGEWRQKRHRFSEQDERRKKRERKVYEKSHSKPKGTNVIKWSEEWNEGKKKKTRRHKKEGKKKRIKFYYECLRTYPCLREHVECLNIWIHSGNIKKRI